MTCSVDCLDGLENFSPRIKGEKGKKIKREMGAEWAGRLGFFGWSVQLGQFFFCFLFFFFLISFVTFDLELQNNSNQFLIFL
jgi:hypothetical protein